MRNLNLILTLSCVSVFLLGCKGESESFKRVKDPKPVHYFMHGDFGSLTVEGMQRMTQPWRISNAARAFREKQNPKDFQKFTQTRLEEFGFIFPDEIVNLPADAERIVRTDVPVGIVDGDIENKIMKARGASIGCATCHSGRVYDSSGRPTNSVWLGAPNTSINLEAYTQDIYKNLEVVTRSSTTWHKFKEYYEKVYPGAKKERDTLALIGSNLKSQIGHYRRTTGRLAGYSVGTPGNTNGVGSLKTWLGELDRDKFYPHEIGYASIPSLVDRDLRSSYLYDGIYGITGQDPFTPISEATRNNEDHLNGLSNIVAIFLIGTMGNLPKQVPPQIPKVRKAFEFVKTIRMPAFPGQIEIEKANQGRAIYENKCASCHGTYAGPISQQRLILFPNKFISMDKIGTDPARARLVTPKSIELLAKSKVGSLTESAVRDGYVAPILTGLWMTAPYLHNGSVPSLWELMNPKERSTVFMVGGHALDYQTLGITYPQGYMPTSKPEEFDVRKPGNFNGGHEKQFEDISRQEKWHLLEYLKTI